MTLARQKSGNGFSLMEVLVAVFILVIIVLILSQVYHQSSVCWSAGVRKARGNMAARAAVGFMARELLNAVADPEILNDTNIEDGKRYIKFITLTGDAVSVKRVAKKVTYKQSGDTLIREEMSAVPAAYGTWGDLDSWILVTNVDSVVFNTPSDSAHYDYGGLPSWVKMRLTINTQDDVSGVDGLSKGPDGVLGTGDDIISK